MKQYKGSGEITPETPVTIGPNESIISLNKNMSYKRQRDTLMQENKALRLQADEYFEVWQEVTKQRDQYKAERDSLIKDLSNYRRVLKVFARLIKGKLAINASDRYIQYQHMLDDIGINTDESEAE